MKSTQKKAAVSGAAAGLVNGLLGAGGGMILVPLLIRWCGLRDKEAFATAISIILPLCLVSIAVHAMQAPLPLRDAWPYLAGGLAGGILAGLLFKKVSATLLHRLLGALILWGGIRLLLR